MADVTGYVARARNKGVEVVMDSVSSYTSIMVYAASHDGDLSLAHTAITKALLNIADCPGECVFALLL